MDALIGRTLGQHTLIHLLAHGGMSEIYLACDGSDTQIYALKVVRGIDKEHYRHFQREVQSLGFFHHPHILPVLDSGEQDGWSYYAMPYMKHGTLKTRLEHGPLGCEEAGAILTQLADTLHSLHQMGMAHGDVKPANILLDAEGHIWLADFGLARQLKDGNDPTSTDHLFGTPLYMAPEQLQTAVCVSSDIYSLGVVLYEMLAGHVPFDGPNPTAICWRHRNELPPSLATLNLGIPRGIERVILCALEKKPEQRFRTARALATAYQDALMLPDAPMQATVPVVNAWSVTLRMKPRRTTFQTPFSQLTKQQLRGRIAAFVVLTLLIIMGTLSLVAILHSVQHSTIPAASRHATYLQGASAENKRR